jgi:GntR family transcriptional regulator
MVNAPIELAPRFSGALLEDQGAPLYQQLFQVLKSRILAGQYPSGALLPGEQDLSRLFEVSRITVKRALNELAAAGFVSRHRGRGTVVTFNAHAPVVKGRFENLQESLQMMGLSTDVELLKVELVPAPEEAADLLAAPPEALVQRAQRLRKIEGAPFSFLITFVPADIAAGYAAEDLAQSPLLTLLEAAGHKAVEAEQWITACAADPISAHYLQVAPGSPLLKIVRVMRDRGGRGVEVLHGYYRSDRFQHHMRLSRSGEDAGKAWA